jgi:hypothetical protein
MPGTKISGLLFGLNRVSSVSYLLYALRISSPQYLSDSLLYCCTIVSLDDICISQEDDNYIARKFQNITDFQNQMTKATYQLQITFPFTKRSILINSAFIDINCGGLKVKLPLLYFHNKTKIQVFCIQMNSYPNPAGSIISSYFWTGSIGRLCRNLAN